MWCVAGLNVHDHTAVAAWCKTNDISLVVIGPEDLLAEGITDSMIDAGMCFTDIHRVPEKKQATLIFAITSSSVEIFLQFFKHFVQE